MNLHDEIVKADLTPEKMVKSFQNIVKILKIEDKSAMTFEVPYEGDKYSAILFLSAIKIDSAEVEDSTWEYIRESNFCSACLLRLVERIEKRIEDNNLTAYMVPVPLGMKPIISGYSFAMDLRVANIKEDK